MLKAANLIVSIALAGAIVAPLLGVPVVVCAVVAAALTVIAGVLALFG